MAVMIMALGVLSLYSVFATIVMIAQRGSINELSQSLTHYRQGGRGHTTTRNSSQRK